MKKSLFTSILLLSLSVAASAQFGDYFTNGSMRFDFYHAGNNQSEFYYFDEVIAEPYWAGSLINLVDTLGYGNQMVKVFDKATGKLIFSRGYCTLFGEWQTTPQATKLSKAMPESVVFPFPLKAVRVEIHARDKGGVFRKKFEQQIDPKSYFIRKSAYTLPVFEVHYSGNYANCVDIVLIPEGYTSDMRKVFEEDCRKFATEMFAISPYKENAKRINVRGVWAVSKDEGVTIPGEYTWKNSVAKAQFYTFDTERYQTIEDFQNLRDLAGNAPYDYIYVLSNTGKYGGGGIYNFYGISTAHHPQSTGKVYAHECGHLFLGLADEYVGNVAYSDFYPLNLEPWEENITTLVNFKSKQWSKMMDKSTPIPTTPDKDNPKFLGVFEGGGYSTKGIYRPWDNCMMNNLHKADTFCPVCTYGINRMFDWVCK